MQTKARTFTPVKVTLCPNCKLLLTSLPVLIPPKELHQSLGGKHVWLLLLLLWETDVWIIGVRGSLTLCRQAYLTLTLPAWTGFGDGGLGSPAFRSQFGLILRRGCGMNKLWEKSHSLEAWRSHTFSIKSERCKQELGTIQISTFTHWHPSLCQALC